MSPDTESAKRPAAPGPDVELALTVIRYTDGPDRCTVYPSETGGDARMSTWLTVDRTACVDLEAVR